MISFSTLPWPNLIGADFVCIARMFRRWEFPKNQGYPIWTQNNEIPPTSEPQNRPPFFELQDPFKGAELPLVFSQGPNVGSLRSLLGHHKTPDLGI